MLLAADVGNTNVKLGIFDGDNLKFKLRFSTDENKTSDELAVELYTFLQIYNIDAKNIDGAIISSVVPKFTYNLRSAIMTVTDRKSLLIGPGLKTGLDIKIEHPETLGADIVALPHSLGRIVTFPEHFQQSFQTGFGSIKNDFDDFVMAGLTRTNLFIGGIGGVARAVTHCGGIDAGLRPEALFRAPKTSHAHDDFVHACGERRTQWGSQHMVVIGDRHRRRSSRQGSVWRYLGGLHFVFHRGKQIKHEHSPE